MFIPWSAGAQRNLHRRFHGKRSQLAISPVTFIFLVTPVIGEHRGVRVGISAVRRLALCKLRENLPGLTRMPYPGAGGGVGSPSRGPDVYIAKEGTLSDEKS